MIYIYYYCQFIIFKQDTADHEKLNTKKKLLDA